uniref:Uncharacterized protein n=1 Tax=Oryza sativa subsp. japonica TaxID=39947 RepID=Q69LU9_ORYSJ|nr:hypothetical protein [Oryza sativa Japonica Group]BAD36427.1 hypothetical protein [Oryza sativa Japonica Group]
MKSRRIPMLIFRRMRRMTALCSNSRQWEGKGSGGAAGAASPPPVLEGRRRGEPSGRESGEGWRPPLCQIWEGRRPGKRRGDGLPSARSGRGRRQGELAGGVAAVALGRCEGGGGLSSTGSGRGAATELVSSRHQVLMPMNAADNAKRGDTPPGAPRRLLTAVKCQNNVVNTCIKPQM